MSQLECNQWFPFDYEYHYDREDPISKMWLSGWREYTLLFQKNSPIEGDALKRVETIFAQPKDILNF